jgi:hypothetical protein
MPVSKIALVALGFALTLAGCAPMRCPYAGCGGMRSGCCAQAQSCCKRCESCPHCSADMKGGGSCGGAAATKGESCSGKK